MYVRLMLAVGALFFSHIYAQESRENVPLAQPTVPPGWTEIAFPEANAEPESSPSEQSRGYIVFSRPITESIYPNTRPSTVERVESFSGFATPGEFEPITLAIYPLRDLGKISVQCSDLVSGAEHIPASAIDVRLVTYWNVRYPHYNSDHLYRKLPELLEKVDSLRMKKGECYRWWLSIHTPASAKAGLYHGRITIGEKGSAEKVELPIYFRVMNFTLQRDPNKRMTAYYYPRDSVRYKGFSKEFVDRATANEYQAMVDYGLNTLPTFQLRFDDRTKRITIKHEAELERMQAAGLTGPLPVDGANAIEQLIQKIVPRFEAKSHWAATENIPPDAYRLIEQTFRVFAADCERRGLPEVICCPLDEIASESQRFGVEVYAALKRAGLKTYATKNPVAADASAYGPYVDFWCSQPFAIPFEAATADKLHEYWSYPNHNAGELKDRDIMCKGGRMTYGYGFWKSGYTTLIPWHWSWGLEPDPLDYLRGNFSGCGQRIDQQGKVIPTVYWECFREGFDDGRYLYTLQQSIWEHEGSNDPQCQHVVEAAKKLLQQIWNSIDVQDCYLSAGIWPPLEFDARRWQMAILIEQLKKFSPTRQGSAPSVYVDDLSSQKQTSETVNDYSRDQLEILELASDLTQWNAESDESELVRLKEISEQAETMKWTVTMDHQSASEADGEYKLGWPRIRRDFARGELDFTTYDYFEMELTFDSNRNEVQDDATPLGICFSSFGLQKHHEFEYDLGGSQRQKLRLHFPVNELIAASGHGSAPWKTIDYLQFFISEANYSDNVKLSFDIHNVRLLRFREPQIAAVELPRVILLPTRTLMVRCHVVGIKTDQALGNRLIARVFDKDDRLVTEASTTVATISTFMLETASMTAGDYQLELSIPSHRGGTSKKMLIFRCVDGPSQSK